jgi:hypothetical protein
MRKTDQEANNEVVRLNKKEIRDEFLNNFYLPRRQEYEDNIDKYISLWPLKDEQLAPETADITYIFQYGDTKDTKRYPAANSGTGKLEGL